MQHKASTTLHINKDIPIQSQVSLRFRFLVRHKLEDDSNDSLEHRNFVLVKVSKGSYSLVPNRRPPLPLINFSIFSTQDILILTIIF